MNDLTTTACPRRPRPVVTLTDAAERVKDLMASADRPGRGLRVGIKNGGCAGRSTPSLGDAPEPRTRSSRTRARR